MKTSNIILLAVFASIIIWIFAAFFTAKAKIKEVLNDHPELIKSNEEKELERKVAVLEPFNTMVVKGNGDLYVEKSEGYSFDQVINDVNKAEVKNDTLFIHVDGKDCTLNLNTVKNINTKEEVKVEITDLESDTINIFTEGKSRIKVKSLKANFFKLVTQDNSKARLYDVNYPNIEAEFFIRNHSNVKINNTKGMALSVKKDPDAEYEDD
jgi:hypothetical protein